MSDTAAELLADLYSVANDSHEREILDDLVERTEYGWRCVATLDADGHLPCGYLNIPSQHPRREPDVCSNCAARRSDGTAIEWTPVVEAKFARPGWL